MRRLVIDELTRARQLADTVHPSPIKMQFRILSAEGHVRIGMSMCEEKAERANQLKLISDYMAYRLVSALRWLKPTTGVNVGICLANSQTCLHSQPFSLAWNLLPIAG